MSLDFNHCCHFELKCGLNVKILFGAIKLPQKHPFRLTQNLTGPMVSAMSCLRCLVSSRVSVYQTPQVDRRQRLKVQPQAFDIK